MDFWIEGIAVSVISTFGIFGENFFFFGIRLKCFVIKRNQRKLFDTYRFIRVGHSNDQLPIGDYIFIYILKITS